MNKYNLHYNLDFHNNGYVLWILVGETTNTKINIVIRDRWVLNVNNTNILLIEKFGIIAEFYE